MDAGSGVHHLVQPVISTSDDGDAGPVVQHYLITTGPGNSSGTLTTISEEAVQLLKHAQSHVEQVS